MRLWSPDDDMPAWIIDELGEPPLRTPDAARLPLPGERTDDAREDLDLEPPPPPPRVIIIDL